MFRNVLDSDKKNYTVNDELDNIRSYICLQNIRFDNVITLHEDVDQKLCQARIMPILFQPVIENSFKYGSRESGIPIKISISGRLVDEHIMVFTIQDDGAGMSVRDWKKYDTAWSIVGNITERGNTKLSSNRSSQYSRADQIALWK